MSGEFAREDDDQQMTVTAESTEEDTLIRDEVESSDDGDGAESDFAVEFPDPDSKSKPKPTETKKPEPEDHSVKDEDDEDGDASAEDGDGSEEAKPDQALVARAKEFGFDEKQIEKLSGDQLAAAVHAVAVRNGSTAVTDGAGGSKAAGNDPKGSADSAKKDSPFRAKIEIDPDLSVSDPDMVKAVQSLNDFYGERLEATVGILQQTHEMLGQLMSRVTMSEFDGFVASLGDEYSELLGAGPTSAMAQDSAAYRNRQAVIEDAEAAARGYAGLKGGKRPSDAELWQRSVRAVLGDKVKASAQKRQSKQVDNRRRQFISRSVPRGTAGRTDGASAVASMMRDRGLI
jgi:hypothetical protein